MREFPCHQCGLCCRSVHLAKETRFLDRGDGACRHYNDASKACRIYSSRPEICRVERQYVMHYVAHCTWDEFIDANLSVCRQLAEAAVGPYRPGAT